MQALWCPKCSTLTTFNPDKSLTHCFCKTFWGWHESPLLVRMYTSNPADRRIGRLVEMNNGFLTEVSSIEHAATYADPQIDTLHRNAHQRATVAPLYGFDISRRACWATLFEVGTSRYSGWADESEAQAKARSEHKKLSDLAPSETGKETPLAV